jgi:adenylate kinase family enzyme
VARLPVRPRRILVVGVSGNGKTALSRRLGARLGLPVTELDALNHQPGGTEASEEDFRRDVEAAMSSSDGWVLDGLYEWKIGNLILRHADTLVWLDQPLPLVLRRLVKRAVKDIVTRRDLFNGNRQTWRFAFFMRDSLVSYAVKQHFEYRRNWPVGLGHHPNLQIVRLRSPREVECLAGSAGARLARNPQDDLAKLRASLESLVRGGGVRKWEHRVDDGNDVA